MTSPTLQGADWVEVLEQIRTALDAALSATVTRERAMPEEETQPRVPLSLEGVEARVGQLRDLAERAVAQQANARRACPRSRSVCGTGWRRPWRRDNDWRNGPPDQ